MGRAVPAVSRALDILELFLDHGTLSAPQITDSLGLPRTTVHELVTTLVDRGYLRPVPARPPASDWACGCSSWAANSPTGWTWSGRRRTRPAESPRRATRRCTWRVLDGTDVVYVAKVDSTHPVRMVSAVGPAAARALHRGGQDAALRAVDGGVRRALPARAHAARDDAAQHRLPGPAAPAPGRRSARPGWPTTTVNPTRRSAAWRPGCTTVPGRWSPG